MRGIKLWPRGLFDSRPGPANRLELSPLVKQMYPVPYFRTTWILKFDNRSPLRIGSGEPRERFHEANIAPGIARRDRHPPRAGAQSVPTPLSRHGHRTATRRMSFTAAHICFVPAPRGGLAIWLCARSMNTRRSSRHSRKPSASGVRPAFPRRPMRSRRLGDRSNPIRTLRGAKIPMLGSHTTSIGAFEKSCAASQWRISGSISRMATAIARTRKRTATPHQPQLRSAPRWPPANCLRSSASALSPSPKSFATAASARSTYSSRSLRRNRDGALPPHFCITLTQGRPAGRSRGPRGHLLSPRADARFRARRVAHRGDGRNVPSDIQRARRSKSVALSPAPPADVAWRLISALMITHPRSTSRAPQSA